MLSLIAAAYGVPSTERTERLLKRIDSGKCRAAQTYVSEVYYGKNDTTDGNTGDSSSAMGRIAWFDALTRKRMGHANAFDQLILNPLQVCFVCVDCEISTFIISF
jgi:hypothetical protein